jgi:RND superfamily putative drug exporter
VRRLSEFILRHRLLIVLLWICLAGAGGATVGMMQGRLALNSPLPGQPAFVASARIATLYHTGGPAAPVVVVTTLPGRLTVASPGVRAELGRLFAAAGADGNRVVSYASTGDRAFTGDGGRVAYALVFTPPPSLSAPSPAQRVAAMLKPPPPGWRTGVTGIPVLSAAGTSGAGLSLAAEIVIGGLGALLVLAWVYASFLAIIPLLTAIPGIMATFLVILGITYVTPVVFFMEYIVGLIGLGIAIDYSLLMVTRWREERARGADNRAAVMAAMGSAGRAIVFSGVVVTVGLAAMAILPVPFLRTVGLVCALIPLFSVAVALTLLPVLLDTIGPRLDWPHRYTGRTASRGWTAWARGVIRARWLAALAGPAHAALDTLTSAGVPTGVLTPIEVLTTGAAAPGVARSLARLPGVVTAVAPATPGYHAAGTALVDVLPLPSPATQPGSPPSPPCVARSRELPGYWGSAAMARSWSTSAARCTAASRYYWRSSCFAASYCWCGRSGRCCCR